MRCAVQRYRTLEDALVQDHEKRARAKRGEKLPAPPVLRRNNVTFAEMMQHACAYSKQWKWSCRTDVPRFVRLKEWLGSRFAETLTPKEIESALKRAAEQARWAASTFNHCCSLEPIS